jgi:hypothetical protein
MNTKTLERLPTVAAVVLVVLLVAACAIRLRGDEACGWRNIGQAAIGV